ncbi:recombinase family protein, partial [Pseudomonas viridiflava]|uniref:recombinase family protein n=1 Tax=Pseudomonas viridiflava TaxID=33069 RepID=UPI003C7498A0
MLNAKGVPWGHSKPWKYYHVSSILRNERYIGNSLWNKKSTKLKQVCKKNSEGEWVRVEKAFSPLIDDVRFFAAQEILEARSKVLSEDQLV